MDAAPMAGFVKDGAGRYLYANPNLLATLGKQMGPDWRGKTDADMWPPAAAALMHSHDVAALRNGEVQVFSRVMPLDDGPHTVLLIEFPMPLDGAGVGVGGIGVDVTQYSANEADHERLATAIEQVAESVVITDRDARITYVNPAFERVTGYARDEVIGQNPRLLKSGLQTAWFYSSPRRRRSRRYGTQRARLRAS